MDEVFGADGALDEKSLLNSPRLPDYCDLVYVVERLESIIPFGRRGVEMMFPPDDPYFKYLLSALDRATQGQRCLPRWVGERKEFETLWTRLVRVAEELIIMLPDDHPMIYNLGWLLT